jgi:hypothetical protein
LFHEKNYDKKDAGLKRTLIIKLIFIFYKAEPVENKKDFFNLE